MIITDSHNHLYAEQFDSDREETLQRAIDAGVSRIFLPNIDSTSIDGMHALAAKHPGICFPMMGVHPCSIKENYAQELSLAKKHLDKGGYCAVGEIGIDLYWDKTFLKEQQEAFSTQVNWAKELALPIVIHVRDSFEEVFELLDDLNDERLSGIFHCFTGTAEQAQRVLDYGDFKIGLGGVLTFKNSGLDQAIKGIDLQHILVETDAPYLAPHPFRGKRNEPVYVVKVVEKLAEIHGVTMGEVAAITTQNSKEVFGV